MATGTVLWAAPIKGLVLPPIEIKGGQPEVSKIELRTESEIRLTITCTVQDVFHQGDAFLITRDAVELVVNRLAFEFSCQIGEPKCEGFSLPTDSTGNRHRVIRSFISLYDILEGTLRPGEEQLKALTPALERPTSPQDSYLRFYRFSIGQHDPTTRFMFLYNLLLLLSGDKQAAVDGRILAVDPQVPVTPHPLKPGATDTQRDMVRDKSHSCSTPCTSGGTNAYGQRGMSRTFLRHV